MLSNTLVLRIARIVRHYSRKGSRRPLRRSMRTLLNRRERYEERLRLRFGLY